MSKNAKPITVLIMAGGTGGHVFPALALAKELQSRNCDVQWLGTQRGIEATLVPKANIKLHNVAVTGVRGRGLLALLSAPWQIVKALWAVRQILRKVRPQLVVGLGGYVSGPGGAAARLAGIPLVIHEQNARAGTTNKILARIAQRVLTAFPDVLPKGERIGNPVRQDIAAIAEPKQRIGQRDGVLRLLVLGGSLGATAINELTPKVIAGIEPSLRPEIYHQSGAKHLADTQAIYEKSAVNARIEPFIDNMAEALAWADLVICRAGALTVTELSAAGVASILVPFPFAIDDHQTANAEWLADNGAAEIRQQSTLKIEDLSELIINFSKDRTALVAMASAARQLAKLDAAERFADICLEVANG